MEATKKYHKKIKVTSLSKMSVNKLPSITPKPIFIENGKKIRLSAVAYQRGEAEWKEKMAKYLKYSKSLKYSFNALRSSIISKKVAHNNINIAAMTSDTTNTSQPTLKLKMPSYKSKWSVYETSISPEPHGPTYAQVKLSYTAFKDMFTT